MEEAHSRLFLTMLVALAIFIGGGGRRARGRVRRRRVGQAISDSRRRHEEWARDEEAHGQPEVVGLSERESGSASTKGTNKGEPGPEGFGNGGDRTEKEGENVRVSRRKVKSCDRACLSARRAACLAVSHAGGLKQKCVSHYTRSFRTNGIRNNSAAPIPDGRGALYQQQHPRYAANRPRKPR